METEKLLTVNEAAAMFNISPATLRGWIFYEKIDSLKINGAVRFKRGDLQRMIEAGRRQRQTDHRIVT